MKERTLWHGTYRDIHFEIARFDSVFPNETKYSWCHYIYVWDIQFPEDVRKLMEPRVYYTSFGSRLEVEPETNPFYDVEFHGGCTYYHKEKVTEYGTLYKVGCDYQHLWDMGKEYNLEYVESEVRETIESLYRLFPQMITHNEWYEKEMRPRFPGKDSEFRMFNYLGEPIVHDN